MRVETTLLHASGEWISCGILALPVNKVDCQGFGSALTYARRYSLSAAVGIAAEADDDGNAATMAKPRQIDYSKHIDALGAAATLEDLQKAFTVAYKSAQTANDTAGMHLLTNAKNERKAALQVAA